MRDFEKITKVRDVLHRFEADAPGFDNLFRDEILDDSSIRSIFQTKLKPYKSTTPSFEELFTKKDLQKTMPSRQLFPVWIVLGAAAACLAILLLIPVQQQEIPLRFTEAGQTEITKKKTDQSAKYSKKTRHKTTHTFGSEPLASKTVPILCNPIAQHTIKLIGKKTLAIKQTLSTENAAIHDSADVLIDKINPVNHAYLHISRRSVIEAYAEARLKKNKIKREKVTFGSSLNRANRLLSFVNTKSDNEMPLQTVTDSYTKGYSTLDGSSTSLLRSIKTSKNDWVAPDNIPGDVLKKFDAVYSLPISAGLTVSFPLFRHFELITGLNYSYLSAKISGKDDASGLAFRLKQELHYIGIPLKLSVNIVNVKRLGFYATTGGILEKGIAGVQKSHTTKNDEGYDWNNVQHVYGFQPGITGQLGVSYQLDKTFNLYVEPGVTYSFPADQPISSRTEEPFNFNLSLGLRYRIH